jgi:hypothetical protein
MVIANHWYVSIDRPIQRWKTATRGALPRQSKSFPTEIEAKQFARAMLSAGFKVMAGTMNAQLPRRLVVASEIDRWIDGTEEQWPTANRLRGQKAKS